MSKQIYRGDHQTIVSNNVEIHGDYCNLVGNGCHVHGDYCTISGNKNTIHGDYNSVAGNHNKTIGDYNTVSGDHNDTKGDYNNLSGRGSSTMGMNIDNIVSSAVVMSVNGVTMTNRGAAIRTPGGVGVTSGNARVYINNFTGGVTRVNNVTPPPPPPPPTEFVLPTAADESKDALTEDAASLCIVCSENRSKCLLVPCSHMVMCIRCTREYFKGDVRICPTCRAQVDKVIVAFQ